MKQSTSLVDASSYSRVVRCVFFLLFFSIFSLTTTNAQVMHRRLWPWPTWPRGPRPFPMIRPRPWPMNPPEPAPSPNPCPPLPAPCPPPKPPPPEPCPPPKPSPPEPCPPPKPPAPGPEPCPPIPPKPHPAPDDDDPCPPNPSPCPPIPNPCPPLPPTPPPKPMPPPPGPKPQPRPEPPRPEYRDISAVFFFGDSVFDTGNNNDRRKAKMKSNYRPYGMNFKDGVATGRFSNGKVSSDYIAKYLGVKKIVKAYSNKKMEPEDLLTGVSFASGGAGYLPKTSKSTKAIPMLEQLSNFQDYIEKVNKLVNEVNTEENLSGVEMSTNIISRGVAFVSGGGNDLINTYFGNGAQRLKKDIDAFTTMMADSAASFVLQLYEYGAKRIGVVGLPPLGCTPSQRRKRKKICKEKLNYASQLFNSKLVIILGQLSKTLHNSTLVYVDIYTIVSQMIESPKEYGFEEIKKSCCKTGNIFGKGVLCKKSTSRVCSNTSSYLFWDGIHPTKRALKTINKKLVKEYLPILIKK